MRKESKLVMGHSLQELFSTGKTSRIIHLSWKLMKHDESSKNGRDIVPTRTLRFPQLRLLVG